MTLTELRYIVAVAREKHFGRAAELCHVSQPTLSVAIKKLEGELGVQLFERSAREVRLTPIGEKTVAQARRVLEEMDSLRNIAQAGKDQLSGPLRLGVIYTVGPYLLPHLIPELQEIAPDMPLFIQEQFTADLISMLKAGELDVIMVSLPLDEAGIESQILYEEPFVVLVPSSHPWIERDRIDSKDLARENLFLLGTGHCFREQVLEICPDCAPKVEIGEGSQSMLEGGSLETIRHMVASGSGVTVVPCTAASADQYSQRLIAIKRFSGDAPMRKIVLAWRASFPRKRAVEALHKAVVSCQISCLNVYDIPE